MARAQAPLVAWFSEPRSLVVICLRVVRMELVAEERSFWRAVVRPEGKGSEWGGGGSSCALGPPILTRYLAFPSSSLLRSPSSCVSSAYACPCTSLLPLSRPPLPSFLSFHPPVPLPPHPAGTPSPLPPSPSLSLDYSPTISAQARRMYSEG
jgi:hypothetical protein